MNPLISKMTKRAAEIAAANATPKQTAAEGIEAFLEAFAALIVAECANAADMAAPHAEFCVGDYVGEQLGFGTKEGITAWRMDLQEAQK